MTASITDITLRLVPKPVLSGTRGEMTFAVYNGDNVPDVMAAQYAQLAYRTLGAFPAMLRQFDFARILAERNLLVFVQEGEALLSAAYAVRNWRDDKGVLVHKGYVSSGKGLAKIMIAALHLADHWETCVRADGEAVARILRSGAINQASSSPFADAGFHGVRNVWTKVERGDIHLAPFAVKRADGLWIGSHFMAGRGEKIFSRAQETLSDWVWK